MSVVVYIKGAFDLSRVINLFYNAEKVVFLHPSIFCKQLRNLFWAKANEMECAK